MKIYPMRTRLFLLCCLLTGSLTGLQAQHCPFDGSTAILVRLFSSQGKPLDSTAGGIRLVEKPNPMADSCTYAGGQLDLAFGSIGESLVNRYSGAWVNWAEERLSGCSFNNNQHRVVVLNMAQSRCMVKDGSNFRYLGRVFEIRVVRDGRVISARDVAENEMYPLCTGSGSWERIRPIDIRLPD